MTREEFWKHYNGKDFEKLQSVFDRREESGFGFNMDTYVKQASYGRDFEQLYFLWKLGAPESTPYIAEIFRRFKQGETARDMIREKEAEKQTQVLRAKADLTDYQSVDQIPIEKLFFNTDNNETYLIVRFLPFLYENKVFSPEACAFGPLVFNAPQPVGGFDFSGQDFGESIYLFHTHNPVELKTIEVGQPSHGEVKVKIVLEFDFAFERNGKSELLSIETTTKDERLMSLGE